MHPRARLAIVVVVLAAGGVTGMLVAGGGNEDASGFATGTAPSVPLPARCLDLPEPIQLPDWYPGDLPLPPGSYPNFIPETDAPGVEQVLFSVNATLDDFVGFVLTRWEDAGWNLGRGEREPGEAESIFFAGEAERYGQFRARQSYCDEDWTEVLLVLVLEPQAPPTPLIPSPTPTPS